MSWKSEIVVVFNGKADVSQAFVELLSQHDRAVDDLDSLTEKAEYGDMLYIKTKNLSQDITLRDGPKLKLDGDFTLDTSNDLVVLMRGKNSWNLFHINEEL